MSLPNQNLWWWNTHWPDEGIFLFPGAGAGVEIDPVAAALEELAAHLRETVDAYLDTAYGTPGVVPVMVGWPDAQDPKTSEKAIIVVTAGPPTITPVHVSQIEGGKIGDRYFSLLVYAHWRANITVTLMCDDKSVRDKVSPHIHRAVDVVSTLGPRGLYLTSTRYFGRQVRYFLRGTNTTEDEQTAMLGEWRQSWTLDARSELVATEDRPAILETGVTVSTS